MADLRIKTYPTPGKPKDLPKSGGREKGTRNRKTVENLARIRWVMDMLEARMTMDISKLKPHEAVGLWATLTEYMQPKLARMEVKHEGDKKRPIIHTVQYRVIDSSGESIEADTYL